MQTRRRSISDTTPTKDAVPESRIERRRSVLRVIQTHESEISPTKSTPVKQSSNKKRRKSVSFGGIHTAVFVKGSPNTSDELNQRDSLASPGWPQEHAEGLPELSNICGSETSLLLDGSEVLDRTEQSLQTIINQVPTTNATAPSSLLQLVMEDEEEEEQNSFLSNVENKSDSTRTMEFTGVHGGILTARVNDKTQDFRALTASLSQNHDKQQLIEAINIVGNMDDDVNATNDSDVPMEMTGTYNTDVLPEKRRESNTGTIGALLASLKKPMSEQQAPASLMQLVAQEEEELSAIHAPAATTMEFTSTVATNKLQHNDLTGTFLKLMNQAHAVPATPSGTVDLSKLEESNTTCDMQLTNVLRFGEDRDLTTKGQMNTPRIATNVEKLIRSAQKPNDQRSAASIRASLATPSKFERLLESAKKEVDMNRQPIDASATQKMFSHLDEAVGPSIKATEQPKMISLEDFLSEVGVRFLTDVSSGRRKSSVAPSMITEPIEWTMMEGVQALFSADIERRVLESGCGRLAEMLDRTKTIVEGMQQEINMRQPDLFKVVLTGSDADIANLGRNLKKLKKKCRLESEKQWLEWRGKLYQGMMENLEHGSKALKEDMVDINHAMEALNAKIKEQQAHSQVAKEITENKALLDQLRTVEAEQQAVINRLEEQIEASRVAANTTPVVDDQMDQGNNKYIDPQIVFDEQIVHNILSGMCGWQLKQVKSNTIHITFPKFVDVVLTVENEEVGNVDVQLCGTDAFTLALTHDAGIVALLKQVGSFSQLPSTLQQVSFRIGRIGSLIREIDSQEHLCQVHKTCDAQGKPVASFVFTSVSNRTQFALKFNPRWFFPSGDVDFLVESVWGESNEDLIFEITQKHTTGFGRLRRIVAEISSKLAH